MPTVTLYPAEGERDYLKNLLAKNDLPTTDLREAPATFYYAMDDSERVGVGGIEQHREVGLLRSVVVEATKRGCGYGCEICDALETKAREMGIETLYLLTTTTSEFFATQGYVVIDRTTAPNPIRGTTEFEDLCPQTAICMRKSLE